MQTLLFKLLTLPLAGPLNGLVFIAKTIQDQIDKEQQELSPQAKLLELESLLLLGEITDEQYQEQEQQLLVEIDERLAEATLAPR